MRQLFKNLLWMFFALTGPVQATDSWMIHVSEGPTFTDDLKGIHEAFVQAALLARDAATRMGIPESRTFILSGHPVSGTSFSRYLKSKTALNTFASFERAALENPAQVCSQAADFYHQYLLTYDLKPVKESVHLTPEQASFIYGPSTRKSLDLVIKKILAEAKSGDRVIFNYAGNGTNAKGGKPGTQWSIALSQGGLTPQILGGIRDVFLDRGIGFQSNIMSCYSGGFNELPKKHESRAASCTSTSTNPSVLMFGSIEPVLSLFYDKLYMKELIRSGNPLEAFSCALGNDVFNFPESSLDLIVERWEKAGTGTVKITDRMIPTLEKLTDEVLDKLERNLDPLRSGFFEVYAKRVLSPILRCHRDTVVRVATRFNQCLDTEDFIRKEGQVEMSAQVRGLLRDPWTRTEANSALDRVNRHLNFIFHAGETDLEDFRIAFCCLAGSDAEPAFCK